MTTESEGNPNMTEQGTPDWRRIADGRLGKLAAIARIGAEPPEAVLAIIRDADPGPDAGTSDTSTIYHESVREFRSGLVAEAEMFSADAEKYGRQVYALRAAKQEVPDADRDARVSSLMAGGYAYALAAVLRVAEDRLGPQSARMLANFADDILTNGDDNDLNADVKPGTPPPPPSPGEQSAAGQIDIFSFAEFPPGIPSSVPAQGAAPTTETEIKGD